MTTLLQELFSEIHFGIYTINDNGTRYETTRYRFLGATRPMASTRTRRPSGTRFMQQRNYALSWPAEKDDGCASDAPFRAAGRYEFQIPPRRFLLRDFVDFISYPIRSWSRREKPGCLLPYSVFRTFYETRQEGSAWNVACTYIFKSQCCNLFESNGFTLVIMIKVIRRK